MPLDRMHFSTSIFELRWPVKVFVEEAQRLLDSNPRKFTDWSEECEYLLKEAFRSQEPVEEFTAASGRTAWLTALVKYARRLPRASMPKPYFSQRGRERVEPSRLGLKGTARRVRDVISDLDSRGYLTQAFGQSCVDTLQPLSPLLAASRSAIRT